MPFVASAVCGVGSHLYQDAWRISHLQAEEGWEERAAVHDV